MVRRAAFRGEQEAVFRAEEFCTRIYRAVGEAEFCYKVTDFYHPNDEGGILWNDAEVGVEWPMPEGMTAADLILSDKDKVQKSFAEYKAAHGIK